MATPYDLFIRFLITKGVVSSDDASEYLDELNLKTTTEKIFNRQYQLVNQVLPEASWRQIEDEIYSSDFLQYMKVLEVYDLWSYEKPFRNDKSRYIKLAYDINQDPQLRVMINALLLKNHGHVEICQDVNNKFSAMLKERHIAVYERFFFNPRRMSRRDWKSFLEGCSDREKAIYFVALTEDIDVVRTELDLSSKISVSDTLQFLLSKSYQKAKHFLRLTTPDSNKEARAWIGQVLALADKYEKHRSGDALDFSKALQMEFDYIDTDFPTPDEVVLKELKAEKGRTESGQK